MATVPRPLTYAEEDYPEEIYPSGDGKPVAETPLHRDILLGSVALQRGHFADDPGVYVSGNMFIYYVRGDGRRHVSPDVFATRGIGNAYRDRYFVWEEGKGPDAVIEVTSRTTRREDLKRKFNLYQDVLQVAEYFLFDPNAEYLKPPLRGYRLTEGLYRPIVELDGRLPSEVLGLHLERHHTDLRFHDPATGRWVPTPPEIEAELRQEVQAEARRADDERRRAEVEARRAETERRHAEAEARRADDERRRAEAEQLRSAQLESALQQSQAEQRRLERELEELRRRLAND